MIVEKPIFVFLRTYGKLVKKATKDSKHSEASGRTKEVAKQVIPTYAHVFVFFHLLYSFIKNASFAFLGDLFLTIS